MPLTNFVSSLAVFAALLLQLVSGLPNTPFHTQSRWIMDSTNTRYKFRCVNWPAHMQVGIPEGLAAQTPETIAAWIKRNNFNCVRLTYSIDMALDQNVLVPDSFQEASSQANNPAALVDLGKKAFQVNPWLANTTRIGAFSRVLQALDAQQIAVVLDNHVSKAQWCCNATDGNGWWDTASGYNADNSRWFNTTNWLSGLSAMAEFSKSHSNVVGMSLRNELRATGSQDGNNHADWYNLITQGANSIHNTNGDLLVVIGGPVSATDLSFLRFNPLQGATSAWKGKTVWEWHNYYWSWAVASSICPVFDQIAGERVGFLLGQGQAFTGPLWLSEFGAEQILNDPGNILGEAEQKLEQAWLPCMVNYLESNDGDWALWALGGSYYLRDGSTDTDESYGLLDHTWTNWRNATFKNALGSIFQQTQGP